MDGEQEKLTEPAKVAAKKTPRRAALIILLGVVLFIVIILGTTAYLGIKKRTNEKQETPTVTFEGKEYKAEFLNIKSEDMTRNVKQPTAAEQIEKLESKIKSGELTYDNYLNLAQLYRMANEPAKALANYELAKKAADPNMPYYDSAIKLLDKIIDQIKTKEINEAP